MNIALLTNEYPPEIYGGAGVHVDYLTRELTKLEGGRHTVKVLCFGDQREMAGNKMVTGIKVDFPFPYQDPHHQKVFDALLRNIVMAGVLDEAELIHCHTWYTHFAGCLLKQIMGVPLVLTTHSLEPHRPWKAEQLGSAYQVSTWLEKTAYENADGVIAVSRYMGKEIQRLYRVPPEKIRVIYNGIDLQRYQPTPDPAVLAAHHIHPDKPYILFVGRITRQKGIMHLVKAIEYLDPGIQIVLCAGAPDTEDIWKEMTARVEQVRRKTENEIIWIPEFVPKDQLISLYSQAALFICPSIYEPFGIINLEAMACGTPVVASAIGGIPEVVVHEENGWLVTFAPRSPEELEPANPDQFARDLAAAINHLLAAPEKLQVMGRQARHRVEQLFDWPTIARRTLEFYRSLTNR